MKVLKALQNVEDNVNVRDHFHVTWKYRVAAHRDCNIITNLNYKIPVVFCNLKNYNALPIKQELVKFDFKINIMPKEVEKYLSFSLNEKLVFIDGFQFFWVFH